MATTVATHHRSEIARLVCRGQLASEIVVTTSWHPPAADDEEFAYRPGTAFSRLLSNLENIPMGEPQLAAGPDMTLSVPRMTAYIAGIPDEAADVFDISMGATEMVYRRSGRTRCTTCLSAPQTTSRGVHRREVKRGAIALSGDSGIGELLDIVAGGVLGPRRVCRGWSEPTNRGRRP